MENALGLPEWIKEKNLSDRLKLVVTSDKEGENSLAEKTLSEASVVISQPFWPCYLDQSRIDKATNLKLAITAGVGSDHVNLEAACKRGRLQRRVKSGMETRGFLRLGITVGMCVNRWVFRGNRHRFVFSGSVRLKCGQRGRARGDADIGACAQFYSCVSSKWEFTETSHRAFKERVQPTAKVPV